MHNFFSKLFEMVRCYSINLYPDLIVRWGVENFKHCSDQLMLIKFKK